MLAYAGIAAPSWPVFVVAGVSVDAAGALQRRALDYSGLRDIVSMWHVNQGKTVRKQARLL